MNEFDNTPFATELLHMIKQSAKRWFIAFCVMVGLEIATIVGFLWYITLPVDETVTSYEQSMDDIDSSGSVKQQIGVDEDGESISESDIQTNTESNEK